MKGEIVKRALQNFLRYGFKTFTMNDLVSDLGMSKKTLYEYYASKDELISDCIAEVLNEFGKKDFGQGGKNIIENIFNKQQEFLNMYKLTSNRPLWELRKYYPKHFHENFAKFRALDEKMLRQIIERGQKEGLFREIIDCEFVEAFYFGLSQLKENPDIYPEDKFPFEKVAKKQMEYLLRVLVNKKGLGVLENYLNNK